MKFSGLLLFYDAAQTGKTPQSMEFFLVFFSRKCFEELVKFNAPGVFIIEEI